MHKSELLRVTGFTDYIPARLTKGNDWYVSYSIYDADRQQMSRRRIRINHIQSKRERNKYANRLVAHINALLCQGLNPKQVESARVTPQPADDQQELKGFMIHKPRPKRKVLTLIEVGERFLAEKKKEMRPEGYRSYQSHVEMFANYLCDELRNKNILPSEFTKEDALSYMNYVYEIKDVSPNTYNNYRGFFNAYFNWQVSQMLIKENPFAGVPKKRHEEKHRTVIDPKTRKRLESHLGTENPHYLLAVYLCYYCFIRPKEIMGLKVKDIDMDNHTVIVPAALSKNRKRGVVTVPQKLLELLVRLKIDAYPKESYLFSTAFKPGGEERDGRALSKYWSYLRDLFGMPSEYQFYSLKDTGIMQMIRSGVALTEVQRQARHSSLEETSIYVDHACPTGSQLIKDTVYDF